jgi:hypothetical protein
MAFLTDNSIFASGLNYLRDKATGMYVCSGTVATVAQATSRQLVRHLLTSADFTLADGDTSGRKVTVSAQNSLTVDTTGGANHLALMDGVTLYYVTEMATQALVATNTINVTAWDIEFRDPAAE